MVWAVMNWSVTGGDILQVVGFAVVALVYVMRIDKQIGIMRAEMMALDKRVSTVEQRIHEDISEIKGTLRRLADRMDGKADK